MPICILMEKPSAFKHMIKALHGTKINSSFAKASFHGKSYFITHSVGHIREYVDPTKMLKDKSKIKQYSSWAANQPIWNPNDLNWKKKTIPGKSNVLNSIRQVSAPCSAIIIATDDDPSGEGDDLGYEIIQAIHWSKPVYRMRFPDEQPKSLQTALLKASPMKQPQNWNIFCKAVGRAHWDYQSMQLSRYTTADARDNGYKIRVIPEGRLKSVMFLETYDRWQQIHNYVKKPYYEVRFKDDNGHVFSRKASYKAHPDFRFDSEDAGKKDLAKYHNSKPANIKTQAKTQAPGSLLNLASLGAILSGYGFSPKQVQDTYQKLYENEYVSYPRTDDKKMTLPQFKQIEPLADKIAKVVGVDPKLLTHRQPRKKFLTKKADHGANRPGPNVPSSLKSLEKFGDCAPAIYKVLSKNFLAILCDDYVYKRTTAQLADYPDFKTSFSEPVKLNYKLVFDNSSKKKDDTKPLVTPDKPYLYQGANPKPGKPTLKWMYGLLDRDNIGTGATRQGTMAQISSGKDPKVNIKRKVIYLTASGKVCAQMARNTYIGNPIVTKRLYQLMDKVQKSRTPEKAIHVIEQTAIIVIKHDRQVFLTNAKNISAPKAKPKEYFNAKVDGQQRKINRIFMNHRFTDDEVKQLQDGQKITVGPFQKGTFKFSLQGNLGKNTLKTKSGKSFSWYGFHVTKLISSADKDKVPVKFNGQTVKIHRTWAQHKMTDNELKALSAGKTIILKNCKSKKGRPFNAKGKLAKQTMGKNTFYGFKMLKYLPTSAQKAKYDALPSAVIDGKPGKFKPVFSHHKFTKEELNKLAHGHMVHCEFKSKKGKPYKASVELKWMFHGKYLGFKMKFDN